MKVFASSRLSWFSLYNNYFSLSFRWLLCQLYMKEEYAITLLWIVVGHGCWHRTCGRKGLSVSIMIKERNMTILLFLIANVGCWHNESCHGYPLSWLVRLCFHWVSLTCLVFHFSSFVHFASYFDFFLNLFFYFDYCLKRK